MKNQLYIIIVAVQESEAIFKSSAYVDDRLPYSCAKAVGWLLCLLWFAGDSTSLACDNIIHV